MKSLRQPSVSSSTNREGMIYKRQILSPRGLFAVLSVVVVIVTSYFMISLPVNVLQNYSAIVRNYINVRNKTRVNNIRGEYNIIEREFQKQWFRMLQARIDWERMLIPCGHVNSAKNKTLIGFGKINETSKGTSFVEYMDIRPAGQFSRIFIRTRTKDGRYKEIGGDFWMVSHFKLEVIITDIRIPSSLETQVYRNTVLVGFARIYIAF